MTEASTSDPRMDPALGAGETAVVLIDLQNEHHPQHLQPVLRVDRGAGGADRSRGPQPRRWSDHARAVGAPVFWSTVVRRRDYADVVNQITQLTADGKAPPAKQQVSLIEGTPGARLVDELVPADGDYLIVKKRRGAFLGTDLEFPPPQPGHPQSRDLGVATDLGGGEHGARRLGTGTTTSSWSRTSASPPRRPPMSMRSGSVFPRMARIMTAEQVMRELGR